MTFLPSVVRARHESDFRIRLTFNDGLEALVDFERWLEGPIFEPLRSPGYFSRFFVEGGTVGWPNGADVAPETLYQAALAARSAIRGGTRTASVKEERPTYKSARSASRRRRK